MEVESFLGNSEEFAQDHGKFFQNTSSANLSTFGFKGIFVWKFIKFFMHFCETFSLIIAAHEIEIKTDKSSTVVPRETSL